MHTSVTSGLANRGSNARKVRRRADTSVLAGTWGGAAGAADTKAAGADVEALARAGAVVADPAGIVFVILASATCCDRAELINRPEVDIPGHEDLNPVTVSL